MGWNTGLTVRFQKPGGQRGPFSVARPDLRTGASPRGPQKEAELPMKEKESGDAKGAMDAMLTELAALRKQNGELVSELVAMRKQNGELLERLSQLEVERKREREELNQKIEGLMATMDSLGQRGEGGSEKERKKKKTSHDGDVADFQEAKGGEPGK